MVSPSAVRAAGAFVELTLVDRVRAGLARTSSYLRGYASRVNAIGRSLSGLAIVPTVGLAAAFKSYADFSDKLLELKGLAGASDQDFARLTARIEKLGRETSFTANQVADAASALARAGKSPQEIIDGLSDTLNLSRATGIELGEAADMIAKTQAVFGLATGDINRIANVLGNTANKSTQVIGELFEAIQKGGVTAKTAGADLEDVAASIGVLANNAVSASVAGTHLKIAFQKLVQNKAAFEDLTGRSISDAEGNIRPFVDVLEDFGRATRDLGSEQQISKASQIFGRNAAGSAIILANNVDAMRRFKELLGELSEEDALRKLALEMDQGPGGAIRRLGSAWEGFTLTVGKALSQTDGPVNRFIEGLTSTIGKITEFVENNQALIVEGVKLIAIIGSVGIGLIGLGAILQVAATAFGILGSAVSAALFVIGGISTAVTALFTPLGAIIALLGLAGVGGMIAAWQSLKDEMMEAVGSLREGLLDLGPAFAAIKRLILAGEIDEAFKLIWAVVEQSFLAMTARIKAALLKMLAEVASFSTDVFVGPLIGGVAAEGVRDILQPLLDETARGADLDADFALREAEAKLRDATLKANRAAFQAEQRNAADKAARDAADAKQKAERQENDRKRKRDALIEQREHRNAELERARRDVEVGRDSIQQRVEGLTRRTESTFSTRQAEQITAIGPSRSIRDLLKRQEELQERANELLEEIRDKDNEIGGVAFE